MNKANDILEFPFAMDSACNYGLLKEKFPWLLARNRKCIIGVDRFAVIGVIGRLRNFGFVTLTRTLISLGGDDSASQNVKVNDFGCRFCEFCLKS